MITESRWFRRDTPRPDATLRLFCLPHAGGSPTLYRQWNKLMPPTVELVAVCPPGREVRLDDKIPEEMSVLVSDLAAAIVPLLDRPWAVFGHSMGAVVAHELALELTREGFPGPEHVFVSAREAPQFHRGGTIHLLDDEGLCAELLRLGGTSPDVLAIPELRELVLPAVRGDYRLIETYAAQPRGTLMCPVTALYGTEDEDISAREAGGWESTTTGQFELLAFPGGHFYLSELTQPVVSAVLARL